MRSASSNVPARTARAADLPVFGSAGILAGMSHHQVKQ